MITTPADQLDALRRIGWQIMPKIVEGTTAYVASKDGVRITVRSGTKEQNWLNAISVAVLIEDEQRMPDGSVTKLETT